MANIEKLRHPKITIVLDDDKERVMKYTLNSFAEMEERYGSVDAAMEAMDGQSIKAVRFMLWAGLVHEDPELTEQYVGANINILDLEAMAKIMTSTMTADLPAPEEKLPNV